MNAVFRVTRYPTNYAGLAGRDLTSQGTIELPLNQTLWFPVSSTERGGIAIHLVQPLVPKLRRALQSHIGRTDLDRHRHQPQHRHADVFHGHQRHAAQSTARLLPGDAIAMTPTSRTMKAF